MPDKTLEQINAEAKVAADAKAKADADAKAAEEETAKKAAAGKLNIHVLHYMGGGLNIPPHPKFMPNTVYDFSDVVALYALLKEQYPSVFKSIGEAEAKKRNLKIVKLKKKKPVVMATNKLTPKNENKDK